MMSRANRLFSESTPDTHYATLVAGRATDNGVELCNAGHCKPLLLRQGGIERIDSCGLPLGLFADRRRMTPDPFDSTPETAWCCIRMALQRRKISQGIYTRKSGSSIVCAVTRTLIHQRWPIAYC